MCENSNDDNKKDSTSPTTLTTHFAHCPLPTDVAEKYFFDSDRHYTQVLCWATERLSIATDSPELSGLHTHTHTKTSQSNSEVTHTHATEYQRMRALEALGRAHLLRGRRCMYQSPSPGAPEPELQQSARSLEAAVALCDRAARGAEAKAGTGQGRRRLENRTGYYDLSRARLLLGDLERAEPLLRQAQAQRSLPLPAVFLVEPDFALVRDAGWFRALGREAGPGRAAVPGRAAQYAAVREALLRSGVGLGSVADDAMRFPLYMGVPQGPLPARVFAEPVQELRRAREAAAGQQRLSERLETYGLREKTPVPSDGNCQFAALSDQLYDDVAHAPQLRARAVAWLRAHRDWDVGNGAPLAVFVPTGDFDAYLADMARAGVWGDHLTLIALAEALQVKITVLSSVEGDQYITEIVPRGATDAMRVLLLSHFAEFHYGSLTYAF